MKVEGIEIWAVRWPDKFSSSADDSSSEFFFQERLCHIGAVRRSSVLHPPEISSCCVRSKKWPNSILQEFEVAITIHGNFAPSLINERMNQWNLSFHDGHKNHDFLVIPVVWLNELMRIFSWPLAIIFSMWFLVQDEQLLICPNDPLHKVFVLSKKKPLSCLWQKLLSEQGCAYVLMEGIFSIFFRIFLCVLIKSPLFSFPKISGLLSYCYFKASI